MLNQSLLPSLRDIVKVDALPDSLGFLQQPLGDILDRIFYDNLTRTIGPNGEYGFYNLDLILKRQLVLFTIPGTDISVVLNPVDVAGVETGTSFNVTLEYRWEILRFIRGAQLSTFSFSIDGFIDLLCNIFGITLAEMVEETINVFIGDLANPPVGEDPLQDFVDNYNAKYTPTITTYTDLEDVILQISANHNVFKIIIDDYLDNAFDKLKLLIAKWIGPIGEDGLKRIVTPRFYVSLNNVSLGIELPRSVFIPIDINDQPLPGNSMIRVNAGSFGVDSETGFEFNKDLSFTFTRSQIMNTGFKLAINKLKVDLSEKTNIPEADADGRPVDFRGVYIQDATLEFPAFWNHDDGASSGVLTVSQMLAGTGGISGTIALTAKTSGDPSPLIQAKFGSGFTISLDAFKMVLRQNAITESQIAGTMKIPGFKDATGTQDAEIKIVIRIGQDGDFAVTASETDGIRIGIPNIFDFIINTASIGREDDRFFFAVSGAIDFKDQGGAIGKFLPDKVDIQKLIIWDDGQIELQGGKITLPKAISLKIGPVALSVTAIGMGSYEQERTNSITLLPEMRKYKYFTFDGGVSVNPGGVDVSGNGVAFYYTTDTDSSAGRDLHVFVRIQSIAIDIIIPGNAKPENASLLLKGFLSMKEATPPATGTEYVGGIDFSLPKLKMGGSAAMKLNPKVPAFIVDIGLELSTPILLGATGLGIYGFRALLGQRYVASKTEVGLTENDPWWQYYKKKVSPDFKEGIQVSKFEQTNGFSLGAGVSLATAADGGRAFSSKIFFLLSLPEVFLLQGQGQLLKERIGLDTTQDPPFFALISITSTSVETAFGVNYLIPDEGNKPGGIATVNGVLEMGFFFGNAASWYINIGRDTPANQRIQVRLLSLFDAYFYLMLSSSGIRGGAGASYHLDKKFGPLRAKLDAYLDVAGRMSFRPKQIGGSIQVGGSVELSIFGFGFGLSAGASLAAEAAKPFMVSGSIEVCVRVLKKDRCARFDFNWTFDNSLDLSEIRLIKETLQDSAKALNMQTRETYELFAASSLPSPSSVDAYMIPMDSYIDIEFLKGVKPSTQVITQFGGNTMGSYYIEYFAPQRGKSDRVRHEFTVDSVQVLHHNGSSWVPYDIYQAATPLQLAPFVTTNLSTLMQGCWQYQQPNLHNKLRIMAQSPLSYVSQGSGGLIVEDLGITFESIFCGEEPIEKTCVVFDNFPGASFTPRVLPESLTFFHELLQFRITGGDGAIVDSPAGVYTKPIQVEADEAIELFFIEPYVYVSLRIRSCSDTASVYYYQRVPKEMPAGWQGQPEFEYDLVDSQVLQSGAGMVVIEYDDLLQPIDKIVISAGDCRPKPELECDTKPSQEAELLLKFLTVLIDRRELTQPIVELFNKEYAVYDGVFFNTLLYPVPAGKPNTRYEVLFSDETELHAIIRDDLGFSCNFDFELISGAKTINWSSLIRIYNLRPDTSDLHTGANTCMLVDADVRTNEKEVVRVELRICTCYTIINCHAAGGLMPGEVRTEAYAFESLLNNLSRYNRLTQPVLNLSPAEITLFDQVITTPSKMAASSPRKITLTGAESGDTFRRFDGQFREGASTAAFSLELPFPRSGFRFEQLRAFRNLRADEERLVAGDNKTFLVDAILLTAGGEIDVTLRGVAPVTVVTATVASSGKTARAAFQPVEPKCNVACTGDLSQQGRDLETFLQALVVNHHLLKGTVLFPDNQSIYNGVYQGSSLYPVPSKETVIKFIVRAVTEQRGEFLITDDKGFECPVALEIFPPVQGVSLQQITQLFNLRPDPAFPSNQPVFNFLVDAIFTVGNERIKGTLRGKSCYQVNACANRCELLLYEVCVLNYPDAAFNATLLPQSSVDAEVQTIINAFDGSIQPIWRPNTRYAINIQTTDKLYRESGSSVLATYTRQYVYGFRTVGPVGHFHIYPDASGQPTERTDYQALRLADREDEFKLSRLLHYVDFAKSYPNADGQLINAKPLYYVDPELLLFYLQTYVYEMFRGWAAYNGLESADAVFEVLVKDPAPDPNAVQPSGVEAQWELSPLPIVSQDITILNNMITYGIPCAQVTEITPTWVNSTFPLVSLKPLKLYTAIFNLKFKKQSDTDFTTREILRYGFQTSRYADLATQVNSYKLKTDTLGNVLKAAVFEVEKSLTAAEIAVAQAVIADTLAASDTLRSDFGDPFNRLIEGALKLEAVHPPQTTEFNVIREPSTARVLGILIKNPEPFNDPKIPATTIADTITMSVNGGPASAYKAIFMKDYSQAFLTNVDNSMSIPPGAVLAFTFTYKQFDGSAYVAVSAVNVSITIS